MEWGNLVMMIFLASVLMTDGIGGGVCWYPGVGDAMMCLA